MGLVFHRMTDDGKIATRKNYSYTDKKQANGRLSISLLGMQIQPTTPDASD